MNKTVAMAALLTCTPAFGASMDYCRPYAAQTAEMLMKYVWLRAYSSCLNSDEDPALPTSQASLFQLIPAPPPAPGSVPATGFDPKWVTECKKYYRTFQESDGTVIRKGSKRRVLCPVSTQN